MAKQWVKVVLNATNRSPDIILGSRDRLTGICILDTDTAAREFSVEVWDRDVLQVQSKIIPPALEGFDETALVYKKRLTGGSIDFGTVIKDDQTALTGTRVLSIYSKVTAVGVLFVEINRLDT